MDKLLFKASLLAVSISVASMQGATSTSSNTTTSSTTNTASLDSHLAKKIHDTISEGWFSGGYENVQATVENGIVTLTGTVNSQSEKDDVEKEIRNLDGVKRLDSRLQIVESKKSTGINGTTRTGSTYTDKSDKERTDKFSDTHSSPADEQLNKKIRDQISKGWIWDSYKNVILHTSNGIVILSGKVSSLDDQLKLVNEIQKIEGVKAVTNNMAVEKSSW
ncbi:MAG: BON domain-containing protein [Parachlamydiaceae bacterium]|nr:BON domain-containing protein [Parachlamydiaceae bacterium]